MGSHVLFYGEYPYYIPQYFKHSLLYSSTINIFIKDVVQNIASTQSIRLQYRPTGYDTERTLFIKNHPLKLLRITGEIIGDEVKTIRSQPVTFMYIKDCSPCDHVLLPIKLDYDKQLEYGLPVRALAGIPVACIGCINSYGDFEVQEVEILSGLKEQLRYWHEALKTRKVLEQAWEIQQQERTQEVDWEIDQYQRQLVLASPVKSVVQRAVHLVTKDEIYSTILQWLLDHDNQFNQAYKDWKINHMLETLAGDGKTQLFRSIRKDMCRDGIIEYKNHCSNTKPLREFVEFITGKLARGSDLKVLGYKRNILIGALVKEFRDKSGIKVGVTRDDLLLIVQWVLGRYFASEWEVKDEYLVGIGN